MRGGAASARRASVGDARLLKPRRLIRVLQCSVWLCWRLAFSAVRRFSSESSVHSFCVSFHATFVICSAPLSQSSLRLPHMCWSVVSFLTFLSFLFRRCWPRRVHLVQQREKGRANLLYSHKRSRCIQCVSHASGIHAVPLQSNKRIKASSASRLLHLMSCRILAERMRAALGQGQLQPNASASSNLSEGQPSMPHDWMLEQALSQVMLTKMVNVTVVTVAILLLVMTIGLTRLQFTQVHLKRSIWLIIYHRYAVSLTP